MKRIIIITVILSFVLSVQAVSPYLKQANDSYVKGQYTEAAKEYEKILSTEGVAPELYFNLGNAYYKSNEIGRSILNYERALRLNPLFEDARFNLEIAQQKVVDNVVSAPTFFIGRWIENLIKMFSSNQWVYTGLIFFILGLGFVFIFIFGSTYQLRKISFYIGAFFLAISFISVVFSGIRKEQFVSHRDAIVMTGVVTVKSSPDRSGTNLFELHEGTKVNIKSTLGNWTEIRLGNGNVGWVEQQYIEKI
jgi:tetratricopeptide (TPR) repeat protein